jgi:hypothetical protein
MNNPDVTKLPDAPSALAPVSLLGRIILYYLRRDCEKCVERLGGTYEIAWNYNQEAAKKIKQARFLLTDARELLRPNDKLTHGATP